MNITAHRINPYTIDVMIEDKHVRITDNALREQINYQKQCRLAKLKSILQRVAGIIGFCAFMYIVGIVGHSDFCTESHIEDTWTTNQYLIRMAIGCIATAIACLIGKIGSYVGQITIQ